MRGATRRAPPPCPAPATAAREWPLMARSAAGSVEELVSGATPRVPHSAEDDRDHRSWPPPTLLLNDHPVRHASDQALAEAGWVVDPWYANLHATSWVCSPPRPGCRPRSTPPTLPGMSPRSPRAARSHPRRAGHVAPRRVAVGPVGGHAHPLPHGTGSTPGHGTSSARAPGARRSIIVLSALTTPVRISSLVTGGGVASGGLSVRR
jgi:hypothetical protein